MRHGANLSDTSLADVWAWLGEVHDPEIPVISIVDLGIVRDVAFADAEGNTECIVTITPTYSGCPAMTVIAQDIEAVLKKHGIERVRIATQLSPAWTTDWMSALGKSQLKGYGIAPPVQKVVDISGISRKSRPLLTVTCPHCGSNNTSCVSQFGSTSCKALYRCLDCLEPFDYFKSH